MIFLGPYRAGIIFDISLHSKPVLIEGQHYNQNIMSALDQPSISALGRPSIKALDRPSILALYRPLFKKVLPLALGQPLILVLDQSFLIYFKEVITGWQKRITVLLYCMYLCAFMLVVCVCNCRRWRKQACVRKLDCFIYVCVYVTFSPLYFI